MPIRQSKIHLHEAGKPYLAHGRFALRAGVLLLYAGFASIIHGLVPAFFPFASRNAVQSLAEQSRRS